MGPCCCKPQHAKVAINKSCCYFCYAEMINQCCGQWIITADNVYSLMYLIILSHSLLFWFWFVDVRVFPCSSEPFHPVPEPRPPSNLPPPLSLVYEGLKEHNDTVWVIKDSIIGLITVTISEIIQYCWSYGARFIFFTKQTLKTILQEKCRLSCFHSFQFQNVVLKRRPNQIFRIYIDCIKVMWLISWDIFGI